MLDAYILDAVRSPRGKARPTGALHAMKPIELVAQLMHALAERNGLGADAGAVDDVLLGCVTATGEQGANIAKIAALYAGWSHRVPGATINRFCASGLEACAHAAMAVTAGCARLAVAGGVEHMSRVPMFADGGPWFADPAVAARTGFVHMGVSADLLATLEGLERHELDAYAARSHGRAARARAEGRFARSIVPIRVGDALVAEDELIREDTTAESLARLPPAFADIGAAGGDALALARYPGLERIRHVHHAGNAPAMADGASLVLVASKDAARALGVAPRARIRAVASASVEPVLMLTGNIEASHVALARAGASASDIDIFEINESFAAVPLHYQRRMGVDGERLNVNGGAIALGHPLGATGGVLVSMALDELERRDGTLALVSICGGAGVASAMIIERV